LPHQKTSLKPDVSFNFFGVKIRKGAEKYNNPSRIQSSMGQIYFDTCNCDTDCFEQALSSCGYHFQKVQDNLWHYKSEQLFIEIAMPYTPNFRVKIDPSFDRYVVNVPVIEQNVSNLAKLLRDVCKPDKIVGSRLQELDYQILQEK